MRLTVLGCAGSFPSADSPASGYLVEHDGHRLVLDLGSGAFGALQRHTDPYAVDAVLLSHLHPDHCADLCGYYVARRHRPEGAAGALEVRGPAGSAQRICEMYGTGDATGVLEAFDFREHEPGYVVGPFQVTTSRVVHPVAAYAIRLSAGGRSLVYSGDTAPTQALVDLAAGTDLALFEASFLQGRANPPGLHLSAREAAEHATRAGADRLVVTHLVAWNDPAETLAEARAGFDGEVSLARPGESYEI